jgi:hypothetical protein
VSETAPIGGLRVTGEAVGAGTELFVRHARRDGRSVAILRAVDHGTSCVVEAEVFPVGGADATRPGPYTFANAHEATAFVTEAVEALMYLGCDIAAE